MNTSTTITKVAAALVEFQANAPKIVKDTTNPFFKSKYATLDGILDTVREQLGKNNLAVVQLPSAGGLSTMIIHNSGEFIEDTVPMPTFAKAQEFGAAMTYYRRYALCAALGIAAEDDDDGNAVSAKPSPTVNSTMKWGNTDKPITKAAVQDDAPF